MDEKILKLKQWIDSSDNVVFFGGAGVSTESGIPDFRSVDGLYNQKWKYPPETILSHSFFVRYPEEYYRFHREKLVIDGAKPNAAHLKLAELEAQGTLRADVPAQSIVDLLMGLYFTTQFQWPQLAQYSREECIERLDRQFDLTLAGVMTACPE